MTLGESHSGFTRFPLFPLKMRGEQGARGQFGQVMDSKGKTGGQAPRVIIFSESGPLGGDLTACLSGRFAVERVTSLSGVGSALDRPAAALLVVPDRRHKVNSQSSAMLRRAVEGGCRVLLLGCDHPDIDDDLKSRITILPQFPSPTQLFDGLRGLTVAARKAEG